MIGARIGAVTLAVLLVACATTPRIRWVELPLVARFESAAAAERGLREVYQDNSFASLVLAGNVVYGNPCSGATRVGGVTGETGVGGAAGETGVGGAAGETGVGGATGETGVGGAAGETGVGGATGEIGVGGVTGEWGVGGARGVVACSADLFRLPAGIQAYEFDGFRLRMVPQSSIVR